MGSPFVNFLSELFAECSDTPTTILTATAACIINGIAFTNTANSNIYVSLTVTRNTPTPSSIILINYQNIDRFDTKWFLEDTGFPLQPGDSIAVFSDAPTSLFDGLLCYSQLNELTS